MDLTLSKARPGGGGVEVLLGRYAIRLDGRREVANRRMEDLPGEYEQSTGWISNPLNREGFSACRYTGPERLAVVS
ncbi:hypothetical protein [Streptomyces rhizosphaerihabitans]|uniref:hypothetical protein n=1 Tax=Streptomyces rhizosphaerihabitans TaxID=1266770 RepID=UPI0021BFB3B6|nr:hypothetical protein [Streptomyces rhizosphaerihabitans]MCT9009153.1 hypothetical protein [Streptomyces rhizosphaerihabitans]